MLCIGFASCSQRVYMPGLVSFAMLLCCQHPALQLAETTIVTVIMFIIIVVVLKVIVVITKMRLAADSA